MAIGGISSGYNFSNYRTTNDYGTTQSNAVAAKATEDKRPPGPPPGGGPGSGPKGPGAPGKGPNLDTNKDDLWSTSEVEDYVSYSSFTLGIDLDADTIMSTYDTDQDGKINANERVNLGKDNAFKLPSPRALMEQMQGNSTTMQYKLNNTQNQQEDQEKTVSAYNIEMLLNAYNQAKQYAMTDLLSSVDFEA